MANGDGKRMVDGQMAFASGVNSDVPRTIVSPGYPDGVKRNQVSWAINATMRGGGISQRLGWTPLVQGHPWQGLYQGGILYEPDANDPHLILLIGGQVYRVRVDTDNSVTNLTAQGVGLAMPDDQPRAFLTQAEMFAVIQAGDNVTNPLFYDFGVEDVRPATLRRSSGFIGVNNPLNEIPPATAMDYFAQRLWYAFGRSYAAGDIVANQSSGSVAYDYRDSVLHVTENPIARGGDAFIVPTNAGNIRALFHTSNLDASLGEAQLFVATRRAIYACLAPVTRADWTATTLNNMPLQKVVLSQGGVYGDRCVVPVNNDAFFQGPPNGDIRSLVTALRYFDQWGQVPLSRNVNRALQFNDRSLLSFASGIQFDNRLWQTCLPIQTPAGVGFRGVLPLDFDLISSLEDRLPPAWEGIYDVGEGPWPLQLFEGDFGGRQRAFAVVWSPTNNGIEVWELTSDQRFDGGLEQRRVTWAVETPAYTWGDPLALKRLDGLELWIDKLLGQVLFKVEYRPDSWPCWIPWNVWTECTAKDCREEDVDNPCVPEEGYPVDPFCESFRAMMALGRPPPQCVAPSRRPSDIAYQFQLRITIKGWCRIRGIIVHAWPVEKRPYEGLVC